jgi:hypothetical protein
VKIVAPSAIAARAAFRDHRGKLPIIVDPASALRARCFGVSILPAKAELVSLGKLDPDAATGNICRSARSI